VGKIGRVRALVVSLTGLLLAACDVPRPIAPDLSAYRFGESIVVPAGGKPVKVEGQLVVSFVSLQQDGRCPKQVTCVWQGVATVNMTTYIERDVGPVHAFQLSTTPESARSETYVGFRIELVDLAPYPETTEKVDPESYVATFRVTRAP